MDSLLRCPDIRGCSSKSLQSLFSTDPARGSSSACSSSSSSSGRQGSIRRRRRIFNSRIRCSDVMRVHRCFLFIWTRKGTNSVWCSKSARSMHATNLKRGLPQRQRRPKTLLRRESLYRVREDELSRVPVRVGYVSWTDSSRTSMRRTHPQEHSHPREAAL